MPFSNMLSQDIFGFSDIGTNVANTSLVDVRNKFIPVEEESCLLYIQIYLSTEVLRILGSFQETSPLLVDRPGEAGAVLQTCL